MQSHLILSILMISLMVSQVGCASIGVRMGAYSQRAAIYPAAANDVGMVCGAVALPFMDAFDPTFEHDAQEGLVYLFAPLAIVDFPLALVLDTALLPFDIYQSCKKPEPTRPRASGLIEYELPHKLPESKLDSPQAASQNPDAAATDQAENSDE